MVFNILWIKSENTYFEGEEMDLENEWMLIYCDFRY
jgi:hypothetical protein